MFVFISLCTLFVAHFLRVADWGENGRAFGGTIARAEVFFFVDASFSLLRLRERN